MLITVAQFTSLFLAVVGQERMWRQKIKYSKSYFQFCVHFQNWSSWKGIRRHIFFCTARKVSSRKLLSYSSNTTFTYLHAFLYSRIGIGLKVGGREKKNEFVPQKKWICGCPSITFLKDKLLLSQKNWTAFNSRYWEQWSNLTIWKWQYPPKYQPQLIFIHKQDDPP